MVTNLTANFGGFFLIPSKLHADVINDWQYVKAEMATKSEMYVKYRHVINFMLYIQVQTQVINKYCTINDQKGTSSRRIH